jgi:hypothetical protein
MAHSEQIFLCQVIKKYSKEQNYEDGRQQKSGYIRLCCKRALVSSFQLFVTVYFAM